MPTHALTSAEISLPTRPDAPRVRERIAVLATQVDLVGLTDNHAGRARMSPLAAVALARELGVRTVVHASCRDRNRLALQAHVIGAAALGCDGLLCLYGDPVPGVTRVRDLTTTQLLRNARQWAAPHPIALGCVTDPFRRERAAELVLLRRKLDAGAQFVQTQMVFRTDELARFLDETRAMGLLDRCRVYASVAILRSRRMAEYVREALPGFVLPDDAHRRISAGEGVELAVEIATTLATLAGVDALHVMPLGDEEGAVRVASAFRATRARSRAAIGGSASP